MISIWSWKWSWKRNDPKATIRRYPLLLFMYQSKWKLGWFSWGVLFFSRPTTHYHRPQSIAWIEHKKSMKATIIHHEGDLDPNPDAIAAWLSPNPTLRLLPRSDRSWTGQSITRPTMTMIMDYIYYLYPGPSITGGCELHVLGTWNAHA